MWIVTICGAVLCLAYSWFLSAVSRFHGVQFSKLGPMIGVVGTLVLVGMAIVGPRHVSNGDILMASYNLEGYPRVSVGGARYSVLLNIAQRTTGEVGPRPSKDHVAYEHPNGKLEWVTKIEYVKLLKETKEKTKGDD